MISILFSILFFFTPLLLSPINSELFELPKMYFVYSTTLLILLTHLINFFRSKAPLIRPHFLNFPLLLFLISQIVSTLISVDPHTSIYGYYSRLNGGLLSLLSFIVLFLILNVYINKILIQKIITASLICGTLVSLYAIAQHFGIDDDYWIQDVRARVFSTFGQPNWLAAYLCILLPLSVYNKNYFLSFLFFLSLLFTGSRSGLIAAIISLGLFFFIYLVKFKKLLFLPILIFILLTLLIDNPIKSLFRTSAPNEMRDDTSPTTHITSSSDIRKLVWQGAFNLGRQYPLFGTGPETFAYSYYWVRPTAHNLTSEWDFLYNKAHNEYLNYLATTGFFGLATYLILISITLINLIKNIFKSKNKLLNLTLLCSYFSILVTNFAGFSVVVTSLYFFLIPVFIPQTSKHFSKLASPLPKIYLLLITIFWIYLAQFPLKFFISDIFYAQSKKYGTLPAQQFLNSAINLRPEEPIYLSDSALNLAKLYTNTQDQVYLSTSLSQAQQAIHISPGNINILKQTAQTFYYLATIDPAYFEKSINTLKIIQELAPTDAKTFYTTAKFYLSAEQTDLAKNQLKKAIELKPNYDHAWFYLGVIQFDQKEFDQAKISFQKVLQINPQNPDAQAYLDKI